MANETPQVLPHQPRPPSQRSSRPTSSFKPCTTATSPWAGGSASAGNPHIKRNYAQIIADARDTTSNPTLIQFKLTKICIGGDDNNKPQNLTFSQFGEFLFDQLKINPDSCLGIDLSTGRYDTRELMLRNGTDTSTIVTMTPHIFKGHEIVATCLTTTVTKVTFKHVPLYVPDEELLHLCCHYGELVDGKVHHDQVTIGNANRYTLPCSTRWIEVKLSPGKSFHNYYWLSGPSPGNVGRRVTVLHQNQPRQCSWCFKYAPSSSKTSPNPNVCKGGGDGKTCKSQNTPRAKMSAYIEYLKTEGYISLKDQHFAPQTAFPSLQEERSSSNDDVDKADHISEEENLEEVQEVPPKDAPSEESSTDNIKKLVESLSFANTTITSIPQDTETPPREEESPPHATPTPARISPLKRLPQTQRNIESDLIHYVKGEKKMPDISDSLCKYAQLAITEKYVDFDPKNPQDTNKTPLGNEKFLSRQKSIIDSDRNRQIAYGQLHDKVLSLIRNPSELARLGPKKPGKKNSRLHSESSPDSKQSQSKSRKTSLPVPSDN